VKKPLVLLPWCQGGSNARRSSRLANGTQASHNFQISQFTEKLVQNEIAKAMIARNDRLADPGEERYKVERGQIVAGFGAGQISLRQSE
jgi:hypothetical protein